MARLTGFAKIIFVAILCALSIQGCAHYAQPVDCRTCHLSGLAPGARDFGSIYADTSSHHPSGIKYPVNVIAYPDFKQPGERRGNILFFDRNGNGQPNGDEVQLFWKNNAVMVECASCHMEHGNDSAPVATPANFYLRVNNISSALCITCHLK